MWTLQAALKKPRKKAKNRLNPTESTARGCPRDANGDFHKERRTKAVKRRGWPFKCGGGRGGRNEHHSQHSTFNIELQQLYAKISPCGRHHQGGLVGPDPGPDPKRAGTGAFTWTEVTESTEFSNPERRESAGESAGNPGNPTDPTESNQMRGR